MESLRAMRLLLDSDAFWKVSLGNILDDVLGLFDLDRGRCVRLPALPHMLRRGPLRRKLGTTDADALVGTAESLATLSSPSSTWIDKLIPIHDINAGEALLFACAAESQDIVLTDDKRALTALKDLPEIANLIGGRVALLETVLLCLCEKLSPDEMRRRMARVATLDQKVLVIFSPDNADPRGALTSYCGATAAELHPLVLWNPSSRTCA